MGFPHVKCASVRMLLVHYSHWLVLSGFNRSTLHAFRLRHSLGPHVYRQSKDEWRHRKRRPSCNDSKRMLSCLNVAVFLVLATSAQSTGGPCLCSAVRPAGLRVNCSTLSLVEVPPLPPDTVQLYVQDSGLTSVPPGHFDRLVHLRAVSLSGNPFHCGCRIQYLRNWLLKNRAIVVGEPLCASPGPVAQTAIARLADDHFASCAAPSCLDGPYDSLMGAALCCVIGLLVWSFRLARRSTFTLRIDERHAEFEADSLRSLKPKHRRRLHTVLPQVSDPERTELLPQVPDALPRKDHVKMKAS
ncbi:glycoprotein IX (platelet) [Betta splendens]|uniref:Glycoprotein IX (Platelet) n=1 Tax=Betta splendens TaxID=158456 RepID=A0A6P7MWG4_BETSP|nr:glycoprotein IX (platelet) [Betta splendens]